MKTKLHKYNNYKNSGVEWLGEIPEHWEVKKLKFLSEIKTGYTPLTSNSNNFSEKGTVWVKPDNLNGFYEIFDSKEKISVKGVKEQNIIKRGSVLVCSIGTIGKFGIAGVDLLTNQQINSITFNKLILNNYGKYLISNCESEFNKWSNGNVVSILNTSSQKNIYFLLPPLEEQTAIAHFLDDKTTKIDQAIAIKQQQIELLKERRQILIHKAVTRGLDDDVTLKDSGVEWIGEIPEHWEVKKLFGLCNFIRGNSTFSKDELLNSGNYVALQYGKTYKVDEVNDSYSFYVNDEFYKETQIVKYDDTILISTSETIEDLGHSAYYNRNDIGLIGGEQILLNPKKNKLNGLYLYYYSKQFAKELRKYATGIKVFRFNVNNLKTIYISVPPISEQVEIAKYIDTATTKIATVISLKEQEIEKLKEYKMSLIDGVVSGKVRVC